MEKLYLIEVLIDKIKFASSGQEVPQKNEIRISVTFGNIANMEIEPEGLRKEFIENIDPFEADLIIDSGKSYLFPSKPENLLKAIKESPLTISLINQSDELLIGNVTIPWSPEFIDLLDWSRGGPDNLKPVTLKGVHKILTDEEQGVGEIDLYLKFSCLETRNDHNRCLQKWKHQRRCDLCSSRIFQQIQSRCLISDICLNLLKDSGAT